MAFQYDGCNYSMIISATLKIPIVRIHEAEHSPQELRALTVLPNGNTRYLAVDNDQQYPGREVFYVVSGNAMWIAGLSSLPLQYPAILPANQQTNPEDLTNIPGGLQGGNSGGVLVTELSSQYKTDYLVKSSYAYLSCVFQVISRAYGTFDPTVYSSPYQAYGFTFPGKFPTKFKVENIVALDCFKNPILKTHKCEPQTQLTCPPQTPTGDEMNFAEIQVPIFSSCNSDGTGNNNPLTINVIAGTEAQVLNQYNQIFNIVVQQKCNISQNIASCPDGWSIRPEYHRPQAIYQFAQIDNDSNIVGAPKYRITVPHHVPTIPDSPLPNYTKGNWEIIFVLSDNSKVTIHSLDEKNGMTVLNEIKNRIIPRYLTNSYLSKSCLVATDEQLLQIRVRNRMSKYYSQGAKNELPDWVKKW